MKLLKVKNRPPQIDALQVDDPATLVSPAGWPAVEPVGESASSPLQSDATGLYALTIYGRMKVKAGDWLVRQDGAIRVLSDAVFQQRFEEDKTP